MKRSQNVISAEHRPPLGELADCRLRRNGYLALENVRCDYHDGVLRLSGHVSTYYLKQIAQETVADVEGVQAIENDLEVLPARPSRNRCGRVPR